jgi:hypothetical protein
LTRLRRRVIVVARAVEDIRVGLPRFNAQQ